MRIYIICKHPANISKNVQPIPFHLSETPQTVRELITYSVDTCLSLYEQRAKQGEMPLTDDMMQRMREVGKFAFGVHYNENIPDPQKAYQTALQAFEDGVVRIFKGTAELTELDAPLFLAENDILTFVKLTMLSGRMW